MAGGAVAGGHFFPEQHPEDTGAALAERGVESQLDIGSGLRVVELAEDVVYPLADYPTTAQALKNGTAFMVDIDRPGCDPAEVEVLRELGYRALLAAGTSDARLDYLLEIYFDGNHPASLAAGGIPNPDAGAASRYGWHRPTPEERYGVADGGCC